MNRPALFVEIRDLALIIHIRNNWVCLVAVSTNWPCLYLNGDFWQCGIARTVTRAAIPNAGEHGELSLIPPTTRSSPRSLSALRWPRSARIQSKVPVDSVLRAIGSQAWRCQGVCPNLETLERKGGCAPFPPGRYARLLEPFMKKSASAKVTRPLGFVDTRELSWLNSMPIQRTMSAHSTYSTSSSRLSPTYKTRTGADYLLSGPNLDDSYSLI